MLYKLHTTAQFIHSTGQSVHLNFYLHCNREFLNQHNTCQVFEEDFIAKHYSFVYKYFSQLILHGYAKKKKFGNICHRKTCKHFIYNVYESNLKVIPKYLLRCEKLML